ncbi:hypothetical protein EVAR_33242_1 [Eumeta japonica]|uniref:Uncharacterized protein n=1 Tax=Eumeta variegata TaxID=151549 RepID=A0A4C1WZ15_EUMVA|nr:hypothetical protein EVAR_33242_1 [Eumeta japonica]
MPTTAKVQYCDAVRHPSCACPIRAWPVLKKPLLCFALIRKTRGVSSYRGARSFLKGRQSTTDLRVCMGSGDRPLSDDLYARSTFLKA